MSLAGKDRPIMIYGASSVCWWVMCSRSSGGAWPATRDGGGRGGASVFPPRGRRTWTEEARISIMGVWGCVSRTQFGRRRGGRWSSTVRWTSGSSGERRHGVTSIPAKGCQRLDQSGSEGWRGRRGSSWALGFGRGGVVAENSSERLGGRFGGREGEKGQNSKKEGLGSGFIGEHHDVEERERESRRVAGLRSMGGAVVHLGHVWRLLGTGGPVW
jgi:hypothetical protein